ncbi:hypothetical protein Dimus_030839 [Dionaea muscipula]
MANGGSGVDVLIYQTWRNMYAAISDFGKAMTGLSSLHCSTCMEVVKQLLGTRGSTNGQQLMAHEYSLLAAWQLLMASFPMLSRRGRSFGELLLLNHDVDDNFMQTWKQLVVGFKW